MTRQSNHKFIAKFGALMTCLPLWLVGCQSADDISKNDAIVHAKDEQTINSTPNTDELTSYEWRLLSADGTLSAFIKKATLDFQGNKISFDVGCNAHTGNFTLQDGVIHLDKNHLIATRRACDTALHQAESALAESLVGANLSFETDKINKRQALLTQSKNGQVWRWQGLKKASAIYGEPVVLYWEIDPEPIMCASGEENCLKIRHVRYNRNGVKVGAGAWQEFQGQISGYHHERHLAKIIRLKAYQNTDNSDKPLYIYDATIESALAKK